MRVEATPHSEGAMGWDNGHLGVARGEVRQRRQIADTVRGMKRGSRALWALTLLGALAVAVSACAGQSASVTATRVPTATVAPKTLYIADWSHGAGGWTLPPHWSIQGGQLLNDGKGDDAIPIPFPMTVQRYTVEMDLQVIDYTCSPSCNEFGIEAGNASVQSLYSAQINDIDIKAPHHGFSVLNTPHPQDARYSVATQDFIPGANVRTYTVSVDGDTASLAISGSGLGSVTGTLPFWPANLSISDQHVQIAVSRLTITTP